MSIAIANDPLLVAPAASRNRDAIRDVLRNVLPSQGTILEFGSGSGEHAVHFAESMPHLTFQPSDVGDQELQSIEARRILCQLPNIKPPMRADILDDHLPVDQADAVVAINVVHITPWETTLALLAHAGQLLPRGGPLYLYGPYHRNEAATCESNLEFDRWLKAKDPCCGLRHLDDVTTHAQDNGLTGPHVIEMPANNLSVVYTKA
ncbi:MAG: DUF938 domain-containing protein [Pseudomonadota bacterium]